LHQGADDQHWRFSRSQKPEGECAQNRGERLPRLRHARGRLPNGIGILAVGERRRILRLRDARVVGFRELLLRRKVGLEVARIEDGEHLACLDAVALVDV